MDRGEIKLIYEDPKVLVCVKPSGILSTAQPGGLPELAEQQLGLEPGKLRTVHRLDRATGGLMVLAKSRSAAAELSEQIRLGQTGKDYLAMVHGSTPEEGRMEDFMHRDKARKMSFICSQEEPDSQQAILEFRRLWQGEGMSLVRVKLITGRTHQIRCQFAHRGFPLVGERKYSDRDDPCPLALFSCKLSFVMPGTHQPVSFSALPELCWPWSMAEDTLINYEQS